MNAISELRHTLLDAARAGDLLGHLDEWRWVVTHPDQVDGSPPIEALNKRQRQILGLAQRRRRISNADVREAIPFWHCETIRSDLARLVSLGLLKRFGTKRGTYYVAQEVR